MLMITMKINSILKWSIIQMLIILLFSQCILASSHVYSQRSNVSFLSYGLSNQIYINNQTSQVICFKKNIRLDISYHGFWPLYVKFRVWNTTGVIADLRIDHCLVCAINYTGLIFHSVYKLPSEGNVWYLFGHCDNLLIHEGY